MKYNNACPSIWFRNVDDVFTLFDSKITATQFLHYLNNCHANIKSPLNLKITVPSLSWMFSSNASHTFSTSIYRKMTFTGLYTKWWLLHTKEIQNKPHPNSHFSSFSHLFVTSFALLFEWTKEVVVAKWIYRASASVINYNYINDVLNRLKQSEEIQPPQSQKRKSSWFYHI